MGASGAAVGSVQHDMDSPYGGMVTEEPCTEDEAQSLLDNMGTEAQNVFCRHGKELVTLLMLQPSLPILRLGQRAR